MRMILALSPEGAYMVATVSALAYLVLAAWSARETFRTPMGHLGEH